MSTFRYILIFAATAMLAMSQDSMATPAALRPAAPATAANISATQKVLYQQGIQAISEGDWAIADARFAELLRSLNGREGSDAALYWRAFALIRAGRTGEAQSILQRLREQHPRSRWITQAQRLQGKDDGDGLLAMLDLPADQALTKLTQRLRSAESEQDRRRVLFVISQVDDPRALEQMAAVARGSDVALAGQAVHLLGVAGAQGQLRQVYQASSDPGMKRRVLQALGVAGAGPLLCEMARDSTDVLLRSTAVQAMGVAGDVEGLARIAADGGDINVRREAIRALGVAGGQKQLLALYPQLTAIPQLRTEAIAALRVADNDGSLLALYRAARTPEEKQVLLRALKSSEP